MSNPTTPFNWQMPTNTDLVTDLPADFEVFGQAVASSMADLLGGTTGQILSKATNADMDFTWIANDQGDITGVTATSPLTGGGTSGAITVGIQASSTTQSGAVQLTDSTSSTSTTTAATPNSVKTSYDLAAAAVPKSTVTTAGDVIYATGSSAVTRLGIGTAGQVLTVNGGATAPSWATPSTGGGMTSIASGSLSGNALSLTSISGSYKDLVLVLRDFYVSNVTGLAMRLNSDTGANYSYAGTIANNATISAAGDNTTRVEVTYTDVKGSDNNNSMMVKIYDYANTSSAKLFDTLTNFYSNGNVRYTASFSGGWYATPAAVTGVSIYLGNGAYSYSGGTYVLYGVN